MNSAEVRERCADQLQLSDRRLIFWAAQVIGVPKEDPADSFVLHAPLELLARAALLPMVHDDRHGMARERIAWLARTYEDAGPSVRTPATVAPRSVEVAVVSLLKAIDGSDLDEVDAYATWLENNSSAPALRQLLGSALAPSMAGAGHGSIALHMIGRSPSAGLRAIRGAVREIARHPDWQMQSGGGAKGDLPLLDALLDAPQLGMPGSNFIFPMVLQGANSACELLPEVSADREEATRALSRVAAWSMLQDTSEHAPYGWTHTLSIPQAVMSLGLDPDVAITIAGGQVIGFRASMGTVRLDPQARVSEEGARTRAELATLASLHHDAHFSKYTLACFDAADADPEAGILYVAAASYLASWWEVEPADGFFVETENARP